MMGLSPSDLEKITPYQFNLLREGFHERQKFEIEQAKYVAYYVYLMAGKVVEKPVSIAEFMNPSEEADDDPIVAINKKYTPELMDHLDKLFNPGKQ